jgi:flagellar protein FliS
MNGYAAASQAYTQNSVLSAPPERLVVMLYDGAGRFLARAVEAVREGDMAAAAEPLHRAHAILDELLATLDFEAGEVAERLESIYLFCKRTLIEAQLARDPEPIERVAGLLGVLRGAWAEVAEKGPAEPVGPVGDLA